MSRAELFREEAVVAASPPLLGAALLRAPFSFSVWAFVAAVLAIATLAFLCFGTYTQRTRVVGITAPVAGEIKLMAPQASIVVERRVQDGQRVQAGDVVYVLSSERISADGTGTHGAQSRILNRLYQRQSSLDADQKRQDVLLDRQVEILRQRMAALGAEAEQLNRALTTQAQRVQSLEMQTRRFEELAAERFMSVLGVEQKREELLEQTAKLQELKRSELALARELSSVAADLKLLPLRIAQEKAELERAALVVSQEIAQVEASRRIVVTAPQDGVITAILAEPGQTVADQPLLTLLPAGSTLQAHLFAPSKAIGFIEPGQTVRMRFAAYPYQKFGQYEGVVARVSRTSLSAAELPAQVIAIMGRSAGEGLYRISVDLHSQSVSAYGRRLQLTTGMQLEADILQESRSLIEWVFSPIIGLKGKL
ncbi:MAG TPA: HlyD family efflux transporter periplasmic adaptor subunit [Burkholderiaceae bacterium]|nr:HlyD family efflux transporter periplasmic adaptor subunit [Burkholderiaceae bacterium]